MTTPVAEAKTLVVGTDIDGTWTVRESAGTLIGRFPTPTAARRFADRERYARRPVSAIPSSKTRSRLLGRLTLSSGRGSGSKNPADA